MVCAVFEPLRHSWGAGTQAKLRKSKILTIWPFKFLFVYLETGSLCSPACPRMTFYKRKIFLSCAYMMVRVCTGLRLMSSTSLNGFPPYPSETGCLKRPGAYQFSQISWPVSPSGHSLPSARRTQSLYSPHCTWLLCGCWGSKLGPHDCRASTLQPEQSPQALLCDIFFSFIIYLFFKELFMLDSGDTSL